MTNESHGSHGPHDSYAGHGPQGEYGQYGASVPHGAQGIHGAPGAHGDDPYGGYGYESAPAPDAWGGGEHDPDATAFVQLPAQLPPKGLPQGADPLAAPGTGQGGYTPPAMHGQGPEIPAQQTGSPMTPAATTDPAATGEWTLPFGASGDPAYAGDDQAAHLAGGAAAMGQGAAAALAGSHDARVQRRPLGAGGAADRADETADGPGTSGASGSPGGGGAAVPHATWDAHQEAQHAEAMARRQVPFTDPGSPAPAPVSWPEPGTYAPQEAQRGDHGGAAPQGAFTEPVHGPVPGGHGEHYDSGAGPGGEPASPGMRLVERLEGAHGQAHPGGDAGFTGGEALPGAAGQPYDASGAFVGADPAYGASGHRPEEGVAPGAAGQPYGGAPAGVDPAYGAPGQGPGGAAYTGPDEGQAPNLAAGAPGATGRGSAPQAGGANTAADSLGHGTPLDAGGNVPGPRDATLDGPPDGGSSSPGGGVPLASAHGAALNPPDAPGGWGGTSGPPGPDDSGEYVTPTASGAPSQESPAPQDPPADAPGADTAGTPAATDTGDPVAPVTAAHSEHPHVSYILHVNGVDRPVSDAWIGESLLYVLRERLGLAGAKDGCSQGECGACSVQVDGRLVASCLVPAATAADSEVRTVEGLATDGEPSDVQRALTECGAVQCGFCVPGLAMAVHDLLEGNHAPTELEARRAICGNLCRCSGYRGVLDAVETVAAERAERAAFERQHDGQPHDGGPNPAGEGGP